MFGRIPHFLVLLLGLFAFANFASAYCYNTGAVPSDAQRKYARDTAEKICNSFAGSYQLQQQRFTCLKTDGDKAHLIVALKRILTSDGNKKETREIKKEECLSGLLKHINCKRGGQNSYANWFYTQVCFFLFTFRVLTRVQCGLQRGQVQGQLPHLPCHPCNHRLLSQDLDLQIAPTDRNGLICMVQVLPSLSLEFGKAFRMEQWAILLDPCFFSPLDSQDNRHERLGTGDW